MTTCGKPRKKDFTDMREFLRAAAEWANAHMGEWPWGGPKDEDDEHYFVVRNATPTDPGERDVSKKPSQGGTVQISGKQYTVLEEPDRSGNYYRVLIRSNEHQGTYWAKSESWRSGRGPWKIEMPPIFDDSAAPQPT